jgi:hypothetical protein
VYRTEQRKEEMEVTRAESFPKEEKRETTTERMRPMKPVYLFS